MGDLTSLLPAEMIHHSLDPGRKPCGWVSVFPPPMLAVLQPPKVMPQSAMRRLRTGPCWVARTRSFSAQRTSSWNKASFFFCRANLFSRHVYCCSLVNGDATLRSRQHIGFRVRRLPDCIRVESGNADVSPDEHGRASLAWPIVPTTDTMQCRSYGYVQLRINLIEKYWG